MEPRHADGGQRWVGSVAPDSGTTFQIFSNVDSGSTMKTVTSMMSANEQPAARRIALRRAGKRIKVQGRYVIAVDDGNANLAAGMGILWLPHYMSEAHVARGELQPLFKGWRLDSMPLYLAFPPNRHVSAKVRVFIDWIVELMARHAPITNRRDL
jgi:hypothetical protein